MNQLHDPQDSEIDTLELKSVAIEIDQKIFLNWLASLPKDEVFRVKGILKFKDQETMCIVNHAFGRPSIEPVPADFVATNVTPRLTVMGLDLFKYEQGLRETFSLKKDDSSASKIVYRPRKKHSCQEDHHHHHHNCQE